MNSEQLKELIRRGSNFRGGLFDQQDVADWIYEVENYLTKASELTDELKQQIDGIKFFQKPSKQIANIVAYLKRLDTDIQLPPITKRNQIFVAMWFCLEMDSIYNKAYAPIIQSLNFTAMRIDKKEYNDSIMNEIYHEIPNSVALIADLTNNRGGVYHEAGIARGLKLCNHPIELIFTCQKDYFDNLDTKPHFDVQGNKIIVYSDTGDLKNQLRARIEATVKSQMRMVRR